MKNKYKSSKKNILQDPPQHYILWYDPEGDRFPILYKTQDSMTLYCWDVGATLVASAPTEFSHWIYDKYYKDWEIIEQC